MRAFHGTWRLVSGRANDAAGQPTLVVSDGLLHYTSTGLVAAQCVVSPESSHEMRAALGGYVAYYGRFTVDEAAGTVVHHVLASNVPGYIGMVLTRSYMFTGNRLRLLARLADQAEVDGNAQAEMVWERVDGL